jgi:hypothetical protein
MSFKAFRIFYEHKKGIMITIQLKTLLVSRILEINDGSFLKAIKTILDTKSETIMLTEEPRTEIVESKKQIEQGLFFDQEEMDHEFEKWQSEK